MSSLCSTHSLDSHFLRVAMETHRTCDSIAQVVLTGLPGAKACKDCLVAFQFGSLAAEDKDTGSGGPVCDGTKEQSDRLVEPLATAPRMHSYRAMSETNERTWSPRSSI